MQTQIFNANELNSPLPLREDLPLTTQWLQALLQDDEIQEVGSFREQGLHMLRGRAVIRGQALTLIFEHKGSGDRHRMSALRVDGPVSPDAVNHLRFVIRRNGRTLTPALTVHRPAFTGQPERLGFRLRGRSGGGAGTGTSTAYQDLFGHAGERHFVEAVRARFPGLAVAWVNEHAESGQPYDVLIGERLAVDVKATRMERSSVDLSEAELGFRDRFPAHHAIALVTLRDDSRQAPLSIDLYAGPQGRRLPFAHLPDLLAGLPALPELGPRSEVASGATDCREVTTASAYFRPGRYESGGGGEAWVFGAAGRFVHGDQRGRYRLQGHDLLVEFGPPGAGTRVFRLQVTPAGWTLTDGHGAAWTLARAQGAGDVHAPGAVNSVREVADDDQ